MTPLLQALAPFRQFIAVLVVWNAEKAKNDKFPARWSNGMVCDAHDPTAWTDFATAQAAAQRLGPAYGVGFVLTASDPFFCLDIDNAAVGGQWSPLALQLCARLPGCVVERSQSGAGLHVWGRRQPMPAHGKRNVPLHIELYSALRFILLGADPVGEMAADCPAVDSVIAEFFPPREAASGLALAEGPRADWRGPTDDDDLIRRALQSHSARSAFGGGASFADLWTADDRVLAAAYPPDNTQDAFNRSSADAALLQHLAFWTGCDRERMRRLLARSALAREKHEREDYVARSVDFAVTQQREVLQDKAPEPGPSPAPPGAPAARPTMRAVEGSTFLGPTEQVELFSGCVYITELHRVLVPGGHTLTADRFRATFGGYTFAMDARNERTTRNAFEAFTESQVLRCPRADGVCFKPQLPYGAIVTDAGRTRANRWWPVEVPCKAGDVTRFLQHVAKLFPHERDQALCLSYLACMVQYPGVKFQVAMLVQGVEGNGKSLLSRVIERALGARYVHWPKARKITKDFNGWLAGNLAYLVEDIYTSEHVDVLEDLKPMITGESLEIEAKGVDQVTGEVCGNFIINTNHKSGLRKTLNDRRLMTFYCAQQTVADLARDGMAGDYMSRIYNWLKHEDGYAAVTHFLRTYQIPDEINFATLCQRAPETSSTREAIEQGLGRIEQEILEAVDQGRAGFAGGWISSIALDKLLKDLRLDGRMPLNRRRDLLRSLGYDWHPALAKGQTDNAVLPDGGRPRLFVKAGHPSMGLTRASDVARAYSADQQVK